MAIERRRRQPKRSGGIRLNCQQQWKEESEEGVALKTKPATPLFEDECLAPGGFALKEDEDEWSKQLIGLLLWDEDEDECPVRQEEQI